MKDLLFQRVLRTIKDFKSFLFSSLLVGSSVCAEIYFNQDILNGTAEMYAQFTHTSNVIYLDQDGEIFYVCKSRDYKNCPIAYPSLGFIYKRHSPDVVELLEGKRKGFWCTVRSLPPHHSEIKGKHRPTNLCQITGWVESLESY